MRDDDKNYNYTKSEYKRDSFEMVQDSLKVNLGTGTKNFELSQEERRPH